MFNLEVILWQHLTNNTQRFCTCHCTFDNHFVLTEVSLRNLDYWIQGPICHNVTLVKPHWYWPLSIFKILKCQFYVRLSLIIVLNIKFCAFLINYMKSLSLSSSFNFQLTIKMKKETVLTHFHFICANLKLLFFFDF